MYKKMLVPLDTSEYAECVLNHVKQVATANAIPEVVLLSVSDLIYVPGTEFLGEQVVQKADERAMQDTSEYLEKTRQQLGLAGSKVTTVVRSGKAADEILDFIEKNGVDIVVMSSQGRSGLSKWWLGSVAEKVIRNSPAPVFVVPALVCRLAE
jgi:nucleotide-binding universal stress UspA family protein